MQYGIISHSSRLRDMASDIILSKLVQRGISDLAPSHGDILAQLFNGADGCTISELAGLTHRTKSTVSVLVDKLVASGYVMKTTGKADARTVQVTLTQKGWSLRGVFEEISLALNARLLCDFKEYEAQALEDMLRRCVANLR